MRIWTHYFVDSIVLMKVINTFLFDFLQFIVLMYHLTLASTLSFLQLNPYTTPFLTANIVIKPGLVFFKRSAHFPTTKLI